MALGEDRLRYPLMVLSEHDDGDIHALKRNIRNGLAHDHRGEYEPATRFYERALQLIPPLKLRYDDHKELLIQVQEIVQCRILNQSPTSEPAKGEIRAAITRPMWVSKLGAALERKGGIPQSQLAPNALKPSAVLAKRAPKWNGEVRRKSRSATQDGFPSSLSVSGSPSSLASTMPAGSGGGAIAAASNALLSTSPRAAEQVRRLSFILEGPTTPVRGKASRASILECEKVLVSEELPLSAFLVNPLVCDGEHTSLRLSASQLWKSVDVAADRSAVHSLRSPYDGAAEDAAEERVQHGECDSLRSATSSATVEDAVPLTHSADAREEKVRRLRAHTDRLCSVLDVDSGVVDLHWIGVSAPNVREVTEEIEYALHQGCFAGFRTGWCARSNCNMTLSSELDLCLAETAAFDVKTSALPPKTPIETSHVYREILACIVCPVAGLPSEREHRCEIFAEHLSFLQGVMLVTNGEHNRYYLDELARGEDVLELLRTKIDMMEEHSYYFPGSFKGKEEYLEYVEAQTAFFQGRLRSLEKKREYNGSLRVVVVKACGVDVKGEVLVEVGLRRSSSAKRTKQRKTSRDKVVTWNETLTCSVHHECDDVIVTIFSIGLLGNTVVGELVISTSELLDQRVHQNIYPIVDRKRPEVFLGELQLELQLMFRKINRAPSKGSSPRSDDECAVPTQMSLDAHLLYSRLERELLSAFLCDPAFKQIPPWANWLLEEFRLRNGILKSFAYNTRLAVLVENFTCSEMDLNVLCSLLDALANEDLMFTSAQSEIHSKLIKGLTEMLLSAVEFFVCSFPFKCEVEDCDCAPPTRDRSSGKRKSCWNFSRLILLFEVLSRVHKNKEEQFLRVLTGKLKASITSAYMEVRKDALEIRNGTLPKDVLLLALTRHVLLSLYVHCYHYAAVFPAEVNIAGLSVVTNYKLLKDDFDHLFSFAREDNGELDRTAEDWCISHGSYQLHYAAMMLHSVLEVQDIGQWGVELMDVGKLFEHSADCMLVVLEAHLLRWVDDTTTHQEWLSASAPFDCVARVFNACLQAVIVISSMDSCADNTFVKLAHALYGVFERFACALRSTLFRQLAQWAQGVSDPVLLQVAATDLARGGEQQLWHATFGSEVPYRLLAALHSAKHHMRKLHAGIEGYIDQSLHCLLSSNYEVALRNMSACYADGLCALLTLITMPIRQYLEDALNTGVDPSDYAAIDSHGLKAVQFLNNVLEVASVAVHERVLIRICRGLWCHILRHFELMLFPLDPASDSASRLVSACIVTRLVQAVLLPYFAGDGCGLPASFLLPRSETLLRAVDLFELDSAALHEVREGLDDSSSTPAGLMDRYIQCVLAARASEIAATVGVSKFVLAYLGREGEPCTVVSGVEWQPVHCGGYLCVMESRIEFLSKDATVVLSLLKSEIRAVEHKLDTIRITKLNSTTFEFTLATIGDVFTALENHGYRLGGERESNAIDVHSCAFMQGRRCCYGVLELHESELLFKEDACFGSQGPFEFTIPVASITTLKHCADATVLPTGLVISTTSIDDGQVCDYVLVGVCNRALLIKQIQNLVRRRHR